MLEDISFVTVLCSSTAAAVDVTYSLTFSIAFFMDASAVTTSLEISFRLSISEPILSVACFAWLARFSKREVVMVIGIRVPVSDHRVQLITSVVKAD